MPIDIDAVVASRKKPRTQTVTIILDPDLEDALVAAREHQDAAQRRADANPANAAAAADLAEANEQLAAAEAAARAESITYRFKALGRQAFEDLRAEYPPTKAQRDEYKAKALGMGLAAFQVGDLGHNPDTFPPVLIAASCVSPAMTVEEAQAMWDSDDWSAAELGELFGAALSVNQTTRRVELGKG